MNLEIKDVIKPKLNKWTRFTKLKKNLKLSCRKSLKKKGMSLTSPSIKT